MDIQLIQVPYHAGDDRHPAGSRSFPIGSSEGGGGARCPRACRHDRDR